MLLYILLYIMLAYLMLFAALSNAVCLHNAFSFLLLILLQMLFVFMLCLGLLTHILLTSSMDPSGSFLFVAGSSTDTVGSQNF